MNQEFGKKTNCYECGCNFYDLKRPKIICPKCKTDQANKITKNIRKDSLLRDINHPSEKKESFSVNAVLEFYKPGEEIGISSLDDIEKDEE